MKLYGALLSPFVRKVAVVLEEASRQRVHERQQRQHLADALLAWVVLRGRGQALLEVLQQPT